MSVLILMNRVAYSKSLAHPCPSPFVSLHVRLIYLFLAIFFLCLSVSLSSIHHWNMRYFAKNVAGKNPAESNFIEPSISSTAIHMSTFISVRKSRACRLRIVEVAHLRDNRREILWDLEER